MVLRMIRSSRAYVFYKRDVLQNVAKLTEEHVYRSLFLIKLSLQLKKSLRHSCEFFEIIKGNFFIKYLRASIFECWRLGKSLWLLVKDIIFHPSEVSHFEW